MKFTLEWLHEYCRCDLAAQQLAELLTMAGLSVESIEQFEGDTVFDVEVTPNRPDCLGVLGLAREAALLAGVTLRRPEVDVPTEVVSTSEALQVEVEDYAICPKYTGRLMRGVTVKPSPRWLRRRLEAVGFRPVSNVVDVTNYVLFETGQPLHAFDALKLTGSRIIVRRGRPGEELTAIDGREYPMDQDTIVIADEAGPIAIAGIMGGLPSEVSESTTNLLLESAIFDPIRTRRTSRRLGLATDSSYRFERGVDPSAVEWASRRAAALIEQLGGGEVDPACVEATNLQLVPRTITLRPSRVDLLLGRALARDVMERILSGLGFGLRKEKPDEWNVQLPSWRLDVSREIDLVEEVARIYGYERIGDAPSVRVYATPEPQQDAIRDSLRRWMASLGYREVMTWVFTEAQAEDVLPYWKGEGAVRTLDASGEPDRALRTGLAPSLLDVARTNECHGTGADGFFELAHVFRRGREGKVETECLGWYEPEGWLRAKGSLQYCVESLGLADLAFRPAELAGAAAGRCTELLLDGQPFGYLAEIDAGTASRYDLCTDALGALGELDVEKLLEKALRYRPYVPFSRYPHAHRDLSFYLPEQVRWEELEKTIREVAPDYLESVDLFDLYRGKGVPPGQKSLAFHLRFRAADRTLQKEELEQAVERVVSAIEARFSASLRRGE